MKLHTPSIAGAAALAAVLIAIAWFWRRSDQPSAAELSGRHGNSEEASVPEGTLSWDALLGVRLRSVRPYGGGLGPEGQLQEYKYLELNRDGSFELLTADMSLRGTYRREGDRVIARAENRDFTGELDLSRGVLTWDGIEFELP